MPVVLQPLGSTLDVTVVDENFESLQDLFRSALLRADFNTPFSRFVVRRYTGGRLVSATVLAGQLLKKEVAHLGQFDVILRLGNNTNVGYYPPPTTPPLVYGDERSKAWDTVAMELFGKPGPSFYYEWQEDGFDEAAALAGVAGWPPAYWPNNRYPNNVCYSPWLTVPGASLKVYSDEPCVARVSGTALGGLNFSPAGILSKYSTGAASTDWTYPYSAIDNYIHWREAYRYRFGLVVDTNPKLYTDEFTNLNPNVVDPRTGAMASKCTWKLVEQHCFYASQRQAFKLAAEQGLKGRRYYNFSMKYRDGGIRGHIGDALGSPTWSPGFFRPHDAWAAMPTQDANWLAENALRFSTNLGPQIPYVNLWDGAALHVEFFYGRSTAYSTNSFDLEFQSKPA